LYGSVIRRGFGTGATEGRLGRCESARFDSRRVLSRFVAAAVAAAAITLGSAATAWGLPQRGHVFGFTFSGSGEGTLSDPTSVAVDEATGEVLVAEAAAERVVRFRPAGGGYEFVSAFKLPVPGAIAVDNSSVTGDPSHGDVYVAGAKEKGASVSERDYVYKFSASGERLLRRSVFKEGEEHELELEDVLGLDVDAAGRLWAYWGEAGQISGFSDAGVNKWESGLTPLEFEGAESLIESCSASSAFAANPGGTDFYVGFERQDSEEECPGEDGEPGGTQAVGELELPSATLLRREVDRQDTSGVAVEPDTGVVYLNNGSDVTAYTSSGEFIDRFGEGDLAGTGGGLAVDAATGDVFVAEPGAGAVAVFASSGAGAPAIDSVSARAISASSEELRGEIDPNGATTEYFFEYGTSNCASDAEACTAVPVPSATVAAGYGDQPVSVVVSGLATATAYYYALVARSELGGPVVATPSANTFSTLPSASVLPDGRAWEMVSPPDKHDASVEGLPREGGAMIMAAAAGGAITWVANGPLVSEPTGSRSPEPTQLLSVREPGGWTTQDLETPHDRGGGIEGTDPIGTEYQAFSPDLSVALLEPAEPRVSGVELGTLEAPPLAPAALEKTIYLRDDPPLTPGSAEQAVYEQAGSETNRSFLSPGYLPLVTAADDAADTKFGGGLSFLGATPQLTHVVFSSTVGLTSSAPGSGGLFEWSPDGPLQPVSVLDGTAVPEAFLGDGEGVSSTPGLNARNAISSDGSMVFWTDGKEGLYVRDVERAETVKVNAAQGQGATEPGPEGQPLPEPDAERQEVHFQTASSDGSKVFFTDTARLTEDSTLEPIGGGQGPADLYEFEVTSAAGQPLRGRLSDMTPEGPYGPADVLNLLPGAGEDGQIAYFVANGVLAPGATPGHCQRYYGEESEAPPAGATCNLYVSEPDPQAPGGRETKFIAALSYEDGADWGAGPTSRLIPEQDLSDVSSRVSPNGDFLAFMSQRSLTGYDNEDVSSKAPGERMDEEVYLYDAQTGRLICASCNPSGQRPSGVYDTKDGSEGLALLVDRPEIWLEHWLAASLPDWMLDYGKERSASYQSRYLSDEGRLFFNSPDALLPQDRNGKEDVYEYEPEGIGSCRDSGGCVGLISSGTSEHESAFLDASESGDEAFFITAAPLVPQDEDSAYDVYDARVCSEESPCLTSRAGSSSGCEATATCRPGSGQAPAQIAAAASETYAGPPNPIGEGVLGTKTSTPKPKAKALNRAQKLARVLKACRKLKRRHRRTLCEKQARERYRPPKKTSRKNSRNPVERGSAR
jgi:hypothetical protein